MNYSYQYRQYIYIQYCKYFMFHYYLCFVCFTPFSLWGDLFWHLENFVKAVCDWKISHVVETDFSLAASRKCVWNGLPWSVCLPCLSSSCPLDTPKWWPATAVPKELVIRCDFPHHWCAHGQKWRNLCTWMMMSLLQPQHSLAHLRISRTFSRFNDANHEHAFPTHGYAW